MAELFFLFLNLLTDLNNKKELNDNLPKHCLSISWITFILKIIIILIIKAYYYFFVIKL